MSRSRRNRKDSGQSTNRSGWQIPFGSQGFESLETRHLLATYTVPATTTQIDSTVYDGTEAIIKQGQGVLVLAAPNTHSGGTVVEEGTLVVRNPAALGSGVVEVRPGAKLVLDGGTGTFTINSLALDPGGKIDVGTSKLSIRTGFSREALLDAINTAKGVDGMWTGTSGIGSSVVQAMASEGTQRTLGWLGWVDNGDASFTVGFAAAGDTNLDGFVDMMDIGNIIAQANGEPDEATTWNAGDFNHDGFFDVVDFAELFSVGLLDQGNYLPSGPPMTPSDLTSTAISPTSVRLSWTTSDEPLGYEIERSADGQTDWQPIPADSVVITGTQAVINALQPGDKISFRLRAFTESPSWWWDDRYRSADTPAVTVTVLPSPPENVATRALSASMAAVSWTTGPGVSSGTVVERRGIGDLQWLRVGTAPAGDRFLIDSGLEPGRTYEYRVWSLSGAARSAPVSPNSPVTMPTAALDAAGDRILDALPVSVVPQTPKSIDATIGDGLYGNADVDFYRVQLAAGQSLTVDLDAALADDGSVLSDLDGRLRVFDSTGKELTPGGMFRLGQGRSPNDYVEPNGAATPSTDDFISVTAPVSGTYYIAVSSEQNAAYDPTTVNSGTPSGTGAYRLQLLASTAPVPTLYVVAQEIKEGDSEGLLTVRLDYPSDKVVTVNYSASPGTATSPDDYTLASGTLTFLPGTVEKTIPVSVIDDAILEGDEWFQVTLSNAVNAPVASAATSIVVADNEPNPLQYIRLARDTGSSRADLLTVNPVLEGRVQGSLGAGTATVEFDHNEDGVLDGFTSLTTSPSTFSYDPRVTDSSLVDFVGTVRMRYRLRLSDYNGHPLVTSWQKFTYTLEKPPASSFEVTGLTHSPGQPNGGVPGAPPSYGLQIQGRVNASVTGNGSTSTSQSAPTLGRDINPGFGDPTLGGSSGSNTDPVSSAGTDTPSLPIAIPVELDLGQYGVVTVSTDANQTFGKFFTSFGSGHHTIQARALEWNDDYGMYLKGPWTSYGFDWGTSAPSVESLALLNVTGMPGPVPHTSDPRIVGVLKTPFDRISDVKVEYDLNADGVEDGQSPVDDKGRFQFTPSGRSSGERRIQVRSVAWDMDVGAVVKGSWCELQFVYDAVPLPTMQDLSLLVDDGESPSDKITTNATVIGRVTPTDGSDIHVYFDFDQDGVADAALAPQQDGQFLYNALQLPPGAHTIDVWASRYSPIFGEVEVGPKDSFSFTLVAKSPSPLSVAGLALVADTGINASDAVTSNPAIKGRLTSTASVARLPVEIDFNADGLADATTTADATGAFTFSPVGLSLGLHVLAARGVSYDYTNPSLLRSPWASIAFRLVASTNEAPVVSRFGLVNDSGVAGDNRSEDKRVSGLILNDGLVEGVPVELDLNGDGIADQTVYSGKGGTFVIDPQVSTYGAITLAARAVEYDTQSRTSVSGSWVGFSFVYEDQADTAPVTENFLFESGNAGESILPSLSGNVRYQHSNAGLRVEIDTDGDGTQDVATVTDATGHFQVYFPSLAANTSSLRVRSLARNPVTRETQAEPWREVSIFYAAAAVPPATIVDLALAEDTGASITDRVTSNPRIVGSVSRKPTGRRMIVEVDTDGDGVANGTAIVGADLRWALSPTGLSDGVHSISFRTRDTSVAGQINNGPWASFSFTLQSSGNASDSGAQRDLHAAIDAVQRDADAIRSVSDSDLARAISTADKTQDDSVDVAATAFKSDLAEAASAYAQGQAAAAATYQAALASFTGNKQSYTFTPLEWPESPQIDRLVLPSDSTLPTPPRGKPDYQGPAFDFNASASFLAANNLAEAAYSTAIARARADRQAQDRAAEQTYRDKVTDTNNGAESGRRDAREAYQTAITASESNDLTSARDALNEEMQAATDAYRDNVDKLNTTHSAAIRDASETVQARFQAAWDAFQTVATRAGNAVSSDWDWDTFNSTMLDASRTRDQAFADASHDYTDSVITANVAWYKGFADAQQTLAVAKNAAAKSYEDAIANHDHALRANKIRATNVYQLTMAKIARDAAKATADALLEKNKQLASNIRTEDLAVARATSALWEAQALAKRQVLASWDAVVETHWTAYQVELADNELAYDRSLRTAHDAHALAIADATKVRADAVAAATRKRAHDEADQQYVLSVGYSDAKSSYWSEGASYTSQGAFGANEQRQSLRDRMAGLAHERAHKSADDGEACARTTNDASHEYATTVITARTRQGVPADAAITAWEKYSKALNNASRKLALANVDNNATWSRAYESAWRGFTSTIESSMAAQSTAVAGKLKTFHETVAPLAGRGQSGFLCC